MNDFIIGNILHNPAKRIILNLDDTNNNNPHLLISGGSGSGKTVLLKKIIEDLKNKNKIIVIIDFHGDLSIKDENLIKFSFNNNSYSINPFQLELDKDKGGVFIQAEEIVQMLTTYFFNKGKVSQKQKNILERLIIDTYKAKGIYQEDYTTWTKEMPTMSELGDIFKYILNPNNIGQSNVEISKIENSIMLLNKFNEENNNIFGKSIEKIMNDYSNFKKKEAFSIDINTNLNYGVIDIDYYHQPSIFGSFENLYSYIQKITNLPFFINKSPKLKKGVNRFDLSTFTAVGKPLIAKFLSEFIAQRLFRTTSLQGEYKNRTNIDKNTTFDRALVIDESKLALPNGMEKENPYNIMNRIVSESRKYGLALILASQRISHYSEEILSSINTKILLDTKSNDFKIASKIFKLKEKEIQKIFEYKNKRTAIIDINNKIQICEVADFSK